MRQLGILAGQFLAVRITPVLSRREIVAQLAHLVGERGHPGEVVLVRHPAHAEIADLEILESIFRLDQLRFVGLDLFVDEMHGFQRPLLLAALARIHKHGHRALNDLQRRFRAAIPVRDREEIASFGGLNLHLLHQARDGPLSFIAAAKFRFDLR